MITIENLKKSYKKGAPVLDGVNLTIEDGCVYGLVGVNGAGKSTFLRILAGVFSASEGQVWFDGKELWENEQVKKDIFFLPDEPFFSRNMTAKSLKAFYMATRDFDEQTFDKYISIFDLNMKTPLKNLSKGMKRQVFACLALACAPKYLLLDEVFDGLDPLSRVVLQRGIADLVQKRGTTAVISSHSLRELQTLCDTYGVLAGGKIYSQQQLGDHLKNLHKFQAAFSTHMTEKDFPFECLSFSKTGSVVQWIAKGDVETMKNQIIGLNPVFVEEIDVSFEELFIGATMQGGYLR